MDLVHIPIPYFRTGLNTQIGAWGTHLESSFENKSKTSCCALKIKGVCHHEEHEGHEETTFLIFN
jgi:hypothetical protein